MTWGGIAAKEYMTRPTLTKTLVGKKKRGLQHAKGQRFLSREELHPGRGVRLLPSGREMFPHGGWEGGNPKNGFISLSGLSRQEGLRGHSGALECKDRAVTLRRGNTRPRDDSTDKWSSAYPHS